MGIIERAVKDLGAVEGEPGERQRPDPDSRRLEHAGTIERAMGKVADRPGVVEILEPAARPAREADGAKPPIAEHQDGSGPGERPAAFRRNSERSAATTHRPSEICKISRERLRAQGLVMPDGARTPVAECIRLVKSQLLVNVAEKEPDYPANVIMVTSSLPGEGKTFCAISLAISIAQERDKSVLLIDADVANPSVPESLGIVTERGLMDVLEQSNDLAEVIRQTDIEKLSVLLAGRPHRNATELLASDAMRALTRQLANEYDDRIIIVDSPPLLAASEAGVLAAHMGQIVVVVEAGNTSEKVLNEALGRVDVGRVAGLVLNKAPTSHRKYGYGYGKSG